MTSRMRELNNLRHTPVAQFDPKGPRTQGLNVVPMPMEGIATRDELVASELLSSMLQMSSPEREPSCWCWLQGEGMEVLSLVELQEDYVRRRYRVD